LKLAIIEIITQENLNIRKEADQGKIIRWPASFHKPVWKRKYAYLNNKGANSFRQRRHVSHSCAVPCDTK